MLNTSNAVPTTVGVTVELFGMARILSGHRQVEIEIGERADSGDVALALAEVCPALVGKVILDDRAGLMESYILNINGVEFVGDGPLRLKPGDSLLLFSSQAGG